MDFLRNLFFSPVPAEFRRDVDAMVEELAQIGRRDDFLSERPGPGFNGQCRHIRAREIGTRLNQIGGVEVMTHVMKRVRSKLNPSLAVHLSYAWADIGEWVP